MSLCIYRSVMFVVALVMLSAHSFIGSEAEMDDWSEAASAPVPHYSALVKDGDWVVTSTETFTDDEIALNGNLTVRGTLVLDSTVLTIGSSAQDTKWVRVENGGSLRLRNGSALKGLSHGKYQFVALPQASVHMNDSLMMDCGTLSGPMTGRGMYSQSQDLLMVNSTISLGGTGVILDGGSFRMTGSSIDHMNDDGLSLLNGADCQMIGSNISLCGDVGIYMESSTANITGSTIKDSQVAVQMVTSTVVMSRTQFSSRKVGSFISSSSWVYLYDCSGINPGGDQLVLDVPVTGPSRAELVNTTLSQVNVMDPNGRITEAYRKDFLVLTNGGKRADQAELEVRDPSLRLEFHGITSTSGEFLDVPVISHVTNVTGRWSMDPHQLWVRLEGARRTLAFDSTSDHSFIITVLLSEPKIFIDHPVNGSHNPSKEIVVVGRIEDVRPVSTLSYILDEGTEVVVPSISTFSFPLSTSEGEHRLLVIAMNDDGRFGTAEVSFVLDVTAPTLELLNPLNNTVVNTTTVLFAGSCEPEVRLTIGGELVAHPQRTFRHYVHLMEGLNKVKLEAVDLAGNGLTKTIHVISDTSPPFIAVMTPEDGHKTRETFVTIKGTTSLDTVDLMANGHPAQLSEGTFQVSLTGLSEGENRISIEAVDRVGWTTVREIEVNVDTTPPGLVVHAYPSVTNDRDITLNGAVDETARVQVNGEDVEVSDGSWSTLIELYQGPNSVLVRATDLVGNMAEKVVLMVLDMEPPVIERVQPPSGTVLKTKVLELTGQAFDENGLSSISGRKAGGAYRKLEGLETWSWVMELETGLNELEVRAEDKAGNVRTLDLQFTVEAADTSDRTPPMVTIVDPRMNSSLRTGVVWVKGTATDNIAVTTVDVRVDGGQWNRAEGVFRWSYNVTLGPGYHILEARASDASGNHGTDSIKVLVTIPSEGGEDDDEGGPETWMFVVLMVLLVLSIAMAGYLVLRRKALKDEVDGASKESEGRKGGRRPMPRTPSDRKQSSRTQAASRRPGPRGPGRSGPPSSRGRSRSLK